MQLRLRVLAVLSTSIIRVAFGLAQAQTPGTGAVTISGSEQGPIYPCGNASCPTYDSGQITITVNGFNAIANYSHTGGQKTSQQLANSLGTKLNTTTSPVTAVVANNCQGRFRTIRCPPWSPTVHCSRMHLSPLLRLGHP